MVGIVRLHLCPARGQGPETAGVGENELNDVEVGDTLAAIETRRLLPRSSLYPADAAPRRRFLAEVGLLLDRMRRVARDEGQCASHGMLEELWRQETDRVERAHGHAVRVTSALGVLEDRWFRERPGAEIDLRPTLALLLLPMDGFSSEDWAFRAAARGLAVQEGYLQNAASPIHFQLLLAPAWFASLLPSVIAAERLGLPAPDMCSWVFIDELAGDDVDAFVALWTPDVRADFFQPALLLETVVALRRLEARDPAGA